MPSRDRSTACRAKVAAFRGAEQRPPLFTQWGIRFDRVHLSALAAGSGKSLAVDLDGQRVQKNAAQVELLSHRQVTLVFGATSQKQIVPSSNSFPASA